MKVKYVDFDICRGFRRTLPPWTGSASTGTHLYPSHSRLAGVWALMRPTPFMLDLSSNRHLRKAWALRLASTPLVALMGTCLVPISRWVGAHAHASARMHPLAQHFSTWVAPAPPPFDFAAFLNRWLSISPSFSPCLYGFVWSSGPTTRWHVASTSLTNPLKHVTKIFESPWMNEISCYDKEKNHHRSLRDCSLGRFLFVWEMQPVFSEHLEDYPWAYSALDSPFTPFDTSYNMSYGWSHIGYERSLVSVYKSEKNLTSWGSIQHMM